MMVQVILITHSTSQDNEAGPEHTRRTAQVAFEPRVPVRLDARLREVAAERREWQSGWRYTYG